MASVRDVVQKDTAFEQKRSCLFSRRSGTSGEGDALLLENRVVFVALPNRAICVRSDLLAAKDDFLEEEDVVFSVNIHFHDHENILKDEFAKVGQMMAFPVFDTCLEACDCECIFGLALSFVDSVGDCFGVFQTSLQLFVMGIVGVCGSFEQGLEGMSEMQK